MSQSHRLVADVWWGRPHCVEAIRSNKGSVRRSIRKTWRLNGRSPSTGLLACPSSPEFEQTAPIKFLESCTAVGCQKSDQTWVQLYLQSLLRRCAFVAILPIIAPAKPRPGYTSTTQSFEGPSANRDPDSGIQFESYVQTPDSTSRHPQSPDARYGTCRLRRRC